MATMPSVLGSGTGSKPPLLLEPEPDELEPEEPEPEEPEPLEPEPLEPEPLEPEPEELELLEELDPEPDPPELELDPPELELELELEEDEELELLELLELDVRQQVGQRLVMKEAFETELFTLLVVALAFCTWTD